MANWEGVGLWKATKRKVLLQREIKTRNFLKGLFIAEISQLLQKWHHFAAFRITKMIYGLRSEQTVTHTALWCSLKESLFCMEYNPFCFKCVRAGILKLWPLLYRHAKVHENAINTMVTCSYNWPTYNICVSSMRFTYSSQDSLFHSESIYIGFKLTTSTVQELCPPQNGLHELN